MEDEIRIIKDNVSLLLGKSENITELMREMYREAALLAKSSRDISTVDDAVRIFERIHGKNLCDKSICEFARFCLELTSVCANKFGAFPFVRADSRSFASIAYMQNSYSDAAFRKFASRFKKASAIYFPGFREVCEDVYYGRSTHAIVPVYSSRDGHLLSFRKLIAKHELKIACECSVEMSDDTVMRFALLQKGLILSENHTHLDLSVILPDHIKEGDFIASLEALSGRIVTVNSTPLEYSDEKYNVSLQIDISEMNTNALFLLLEGTQISYDLLGFYSVLD